MSRGRKITIGVLSLVLVLLLIIVFYHIIYLKDDKKVYKDKVISVCSEDVSCGYSDLRFTFINSDYDSLVLQKKIDEVNQKILDDYREVKNSRLSFSDCGPVAAVFQHSAYIQDSLSVYENKSYFIISLVTTESNLCTENEIVSSESLVSYFFDKKKDQFLSEEEFKKRVGLDDATIESLVSTDVATLNANGNNYVVDRDRGYHIQVLKEGTIQVYYYILGSDVGHSVWTAAEIK